MKAPQRRAILPTGAYEEMRPLVLKGFLSVRQTGIINLGFDQIYFHFDVFLIFCICKSLRFSNVVKYILV